MAESEQKLQQMKLDLSKLKSDGEVLESDSQVHEYNGHRFIMNTFYEDTLCQFCTKLLLNRQGYYCAGLSFSFFLLSCEITKERITKQNKTKQNKTKPNKKKQKQKTKNKNNNKTKTKNKKKNI